MDAGLRRLVRERARNRCEYCLMPQEQDTFYTFPVDHIIAQQHHGETAPDNLCLSCYRCNAHKGPNIAAIDPKSRTLVPLFNPRQDGWHEHFEWRGAILLGSTAVGRATVELLAINHPDYVLLREMLIEEGSFRG